jgi:hypothetical protein
MGPEDSSRRQFEAALIEKCWRDSEFKKAVVSDPKGMLERHTGQKLPPQFKIFIHEEDANTLHLSVPPAPSNLLELSDADLEKVAGGQMVADPQVTWLDTMVVTVTAQKPADQGW